ncbi:phosphoribosylaminoimidazolesuccinocarboxamide synthase [uncultured Amnibacterium sp.]|uniref:phosphoribosylaminoimidazolesuccinocarboxamide synthase n=1 Tax=uncultured Amnibacterium sp. TaxID=1631851 RepID=UPI0035CB4CEC
MSAPQLPGWRHVASGKVRELYRPQVADGTMLLVATDRVSAFDVVLTPAIPGKGALLTRLSRWWFEHLPDVPNHLVADQSAVPRAVRDRAMLVRSLHMHPVECVVRGYLTGSGLLEYRRTGAVCGVALPAGLQDGDRLPEPIFTPAFKAEPGEHDPNITFDEVVALVGSETAAGLRDTSLHMYATAERISRERGLLLADTKFEFGDDPVTGELVLADEVLTSDSSRYWDAAAYDEGRRGVGFDKQIVRDWIQEHWDGKGSPPVLPPEIVTQTAARYAELVDRLVS